MAPAGARARLTRGRAGPVGQTQGEGALQPLTTALPARVPCAVPGKPLPEPRHSLGAW